MRWADSVIILFYTFALFVTGLFLSGLALEFVPAAAVVSVIRQISFDEWVRWQTVSVGLLMMFTSLATLYMFRQRARRQKHIIYRNENGQIRLAVNALEELVRDIGREFLDVRTIRPRLKVRKNAVTVHAVLSLYSGAQIGSLAERLQENIKTQLDTLLGKEIKVSAVIIIRHLDRRAQKHSKGSSAEHGMQQMTPDVHGSSVHMGQQ